MKLTLILVAAFSLALGACTAAQVQQAVVVFGDVALDAASIAATAELNSGKITLPEYTAIEQILADARTSIQTGTLTQAQVQATEADAVAAVNAILVPQAATPVAKAGAAKYLAAAKAKAKK
jgi:alanine dehydrogenase